MNYKTIQKIIAMTKAGYSADEIETAILGEIK